MSDFSGSNPPPPRRDDRAPAAGSVPVTGTSATTSYGSSEGVPGTGTETQGTRAPSPAAGDLGTGVSGAGVPGAGGASGPTAGGAGASYGTAGGSPGMNANPPIAAPASMPGSGATRMDAMSGLLARNWWALALRGVLGILFGLVALFFPGPTLLSLALFFAVYVFIDGLFAIVAAVRAAQAHHRWGLLLLEGVLGIAMGIVAFLFPVGAVLAFVLVTAAWALVTGGLMFASAFSLHAGYGRIWLALGGLVSIAWGVLLVIAPLIGAVVLTWWLGGYAIAFGVFLLVLAFQLRSRHRTGGGDGPTTSWSGRV